MPNITLPDGSVRSFEAAVSGSEVAAGIGRKLEKDAVAIRVNGELRDLTTTLESDASVEIITRTSDDGCAYLRVALGDGLHPGWTGSG